LDKTTNIIPILPLEQTFYNVEKNTIEDWKINKKYSLDLENIANFLALGFMLGDTTYFKEIKVLKPASKYIIDEKQNIHIKGSDWNWHYTPKDLTFHEVLEDFIGILEGIIKNKIGDKSVLLPISGGLDSRTLFVASKHSTKLNLASYEFEGGLKESYVGENLSKYFNLPFFSQQIPNGYLWSKINEISKLNGCLTDFTHPRQVSVLNSWKSVADVVLLGHWGDVLFDSFRLKKNISYEEQLFYLKNKILINSGGIELARELWGVWGLSESFDIKFNNLIDSLYSSINIDHPCAKLRAFKSLYWAPRWTSTNLSLFKNLGELVVPYYNNKMCNFVCSVEDEYLSGRKIQIEYIKKFCYISSNLKWDKYEPLNLNTYNYFSHRAYLPIRGFNKIKRLLSEKFIGKESPIIRNWEIQFLGQNNYKNLYNHLINSSLVKLVPKDIILKYLNKFNDEPVKYSHPISMLLTLALFSRQYYRK